MVAWRDQAQARAWRTYIEASVRLETRLEADLQAHSGLSLIDYHVLVQLDEAPDQRLRMGQLAEQLVFAPSRLTYQIKSMERRGLVVRERCLEDRRGTRAVLTATGLHMLQDAAPQHRRAIRELWLDHLDPGELQGLTIVFDRLQQCLTGATTDRV